jgi:LSD1 subclass zinc finger protein
MSLRERRCRADAAKIAACFGPGRSISVQESEGDPVERYVIEYRVPGLAVRGGVVEPRGTHRVEVFLTLAYPRQAPQCRMLTPVFHPNIAPHAICISDHWSAGESLASLLVRIAEMICFQSYNVKSPLNGDAARWAEQHAADLPLCRDDFHELLAAAEEAPLPAAPPSPAPAAQDPVAGEAGRTIPAVASDRPREVACPHCRTPLALAPGWSHRFARCPICARVIEVPPGG